MSRYAREIRMPLFCPSQPVSRNAFLREVSMAEASRERLSTTILDEATGLKIVERRRSGGKAGWLGGKSGARGDSEATR